MPPPWPNTNGTEANTRTAILGRYIVVYCGMNISKYGQRNGMKGEHDPLDFIEF